jgi:hypothetical protein
MERSAEIRAIERAFAIRVEGIFDALCASIELESHDAKRDPTQANSKKEFAKAYSFAKIALKEALDVVNA